LYSCHDVTEATDLSVMSQTIYLVDAFNFAHKAECLRRYLGSGAYEQLIGHMATLIRKYIENKSAKAVLIFDNNKAPGSHRKLSRHIEVVFTRPGQTADSYIIELLRRQGHSGIIVVSSDNEILNAARDHQAVPMKSEYFYNLLRKHHSKQNEPSDKPQTGTEDIDFFRKLFGEKL